MSIPLKNLINANTLLSEGLVTDEWYEYTKKNGDKMERGEIKEITADDVRKLKELCWRMIALYFWKVKAKGEGWAATRFKPGEEASVYMAAELAAYTTLCDHLDIAKTQENFGELFEGIKSMDNDPQLVEYRRRFGW